MPTDPNPLILKLLRGDPSAYTDLRALDEDAVTPLVDAFYAGVNEAQGATILRLLAEIGGYEALQLLEDVALNSEKAAWQQIALDGLRANGRGDILEDNGQ